MLEKVMKGIQRRLKEARRGAQLICSDLIQNWLAAGVACPLKFRPVLYRIAGNKIGKNCNIAMNVHFINGTHEIGDETRRAAQGITKRIVVGDGSWIGADTIIMPGVTIGKGVIVGTGSLVTSNLDDNAIYFGRPARLYKKL